MRLTLALLLTPKAWLKMEKGKAPLEVINIDELKKVPTEN